jgi:hypothetical protein
MIRKSIAISLACGFACTLLSVAQSNVAHAKMTAAQIANNNVAARGGLQAWRGVQSLSETGKLTAGGDDRKPAAPAIPGAKRPARMAQIPSSPRLKEEVQLPFVMEMERPRKMRFELQFNGDTAVQVYDGSHGWKVRPYLNRRDVESFTDNELRLASMQSELDGPLVDYEKKGTQLELVGMEKVGDRDTYNLKLTMKDGLTTHVWIDSETFLEAKAEGQPRRLDGKDHPVEVYYRDYRKVNGLQMPFLLETRVLPLLGGGLGQQPVQYPPEKIVIDTITINPRLSDSRFAKPEIEMASTKR